MSGQDSRLLGRWGEDLAADYLREKGYQIRACNWKCRYGELDIVAEDRRFLCFVEVKLRKTDAFGQPGEFVDARKQQRLRTAARLYLAQNPTGLQPRMDVIEIHAPQGVQTPRPTLKHLKNAF